MTKHTYTTAGQYAEALERVIKMEILPLIPNLILADIIVALSEKRRESTNAEWKAIDKISSAAVKIFNDNAEKEKTGSDDE